MASSVFVFLRPALHDAPSHALHRSISTTSLRRSGVPSSKSKSHLIVPSTSFLPPRGFAVSGVHAGVKSSSPPSKLDVAIVISDRPASAAACFTRNAFQAAPVQVSRDVLKNGNGKARAIAVNSGCANAVTGKQGLEDAWAMSHKVDELLKQGAASGGDLQKQQGATGTLVMSTGVIGQLLPIRRILSGISAAHWSLGSSYDAWNGVASAFMTTDTFPKLRSRSFQLGGKEVRFAGIDKGAGMIHPNMGPPHATLLGLIATDAAIEPSSLQNALTYAVNRSFNSISVDGDMSTNDTIIALANGASGANEISEKGTPEEFGQFREELTTFAQELAQLIVRDGEGATKFVKVDVRNAPSYEGAHRIASTISTSSLVKTALHGEDANWGRILCAIGYTSPLDFSIIPEKVSVSFIPSDGSEELRLLVNGEPEKVDEDRAKQILSVEDLEIRVDLGLGKESAQYWTCDLSKEYISINADYRS